MPATFYVDQEKTFKKVIFLSCEPKRAFGGTSGEQDTTKAGVPKWEVQVAATFESFGKLENEILKISIASHADPAELIGGPDLVDIIGFRVRVNPPEKRVDRSGAERTTGGAATYQADGIVLVSRGKGAN